MYVCSYCSVVALEATGHIGVELFYTAVGEVQRLLCYRYIGILVLVYTSMQFARRSDTRAKLALT
jgi:hypothetical protein